MITFFISILALVLGYVFYGKLMENIFGADGNRETPAMSMNDGVDYLSLLIPATSFLLRKDLDCRMPFLFRPDYCVQ